MNRNLFFLIILIICIISCSERYTPKPRAFVKLELPEKNYTIFDSSCPFYFEIPTYSHIETKKEDCLFDIVFNQLNAKIHITYLPITDNLYKHTEQSRSLAYKHNIVADRITEQLYINDSIRVYGVFYDYAGITATSSQFYLTDSVNHFFRGALYFSTQISDSLLPVNNFLKEDVKHLIESFCWKDN